VALVVLTAGGFVDELLEKIEANMISETDNATIDTIVQTLKRCRSILFITGAGVSADSGLPTYRGIGGLYDVDVTEEGFPIEEVLSAEMLGRRPELTWKYLAQIGLAAQGATHNRAHEVIVEFENQFERVWTLTQNVDGFHRSAGSKNLIEAHGNMRTLSCTKCDFQAGVERFDTIEIPPKCPACDSLVRPDVVLFGELLKGEGIDELSRQLETGFDIVFSVGTTSVFPYIQQPIYMARQMQKVSIEINPCETEVSSVVDHRLALGAAEALGEIWNRIQLDKSRKPKIQND
jgi:NAD-dependent deacetylase